MRTKWSYDLLTDSENYVAHLERYTASIVSIIRFGRRIRTVTDLIITEVLLLMQRAAEHNVPGNSFPMIIESFLSQHFLISCNPCLRKISSGKIPKVDGTIDEEHGKAAGKELIAY
jgi:hypothetical protein